MQRIFLIAHGVVQGVGYRHFVFRTALKYGIKGWVRNADDGSVEILAEGDDEKLKWFKKDINVDFQNGPTVFKLDKDDDRLVEYEQEKYKDFSIAD